MPPSPPPAARAPKTALARTPKPSAELGPLPEWDLSDLYPGMDSPEFAGDVARAEAECKAFAAAYRGKLDGMAQAENAADALDEAVKRYEGIEDLLGRIMSYAGLIYSGDTTDPKRAKFYGDAQERMTAASSELLFFALELNRIEDAVLDAAMAQEPLAHYRPWRGPAPGQALPARRQARAALPREIGHRPRRLEPALRRDHRVAPIRRARRGARHRADP